MQKKTKAIMKDWNIKYRDTRTGETKMYDVGICTRDQAVNAFNRQVKDARIQEVTQDSEEWRHKVRK